MRGKARATQQSWKRFDETQVKHFLTSTVSAEYREAGQQQKGDVPVGLHQCADDLFPQFSLPELVSHDRTQVKLDRSDSEQETREQCHVYTWRYSMYGRISLATVGVWRQIRLSAAAEESELMTVHA